MSTEFKIDSMHANLPPLIARLIKAMNDRDSAAFIACFANHAVVLNEGQHYVGVTAIKAWIEKMNRKYQFILDVTRTSEHGTNTVVSALVSGNFDGSPIERDHHLTIVDGRIFLFATNGSKLEDASCPTSSAVLQPAS
ncbi:MAG TPA: nuclear transport factor 2 family protein [Opitutaceae bacterium]|nr:nuclear transport factor 2 family protein [Opitutaceae bacterium]